MPLRLPDRDPPDLEDALRATVLMLADHLVARGVVYRWGGCHPETGLDCSGFVIWVYQQAGILPRPFDTTADGLRKLCDPLTASMRPGDLVFYGGHVATHVMMLAESGRVVGATGGGRHTLTREIALAQHASVRYEPADYRGDVIGFGRLPVRV